jgi:V8-like Glu-specific endopeptidase
MKLIATLIASLFAVTAFAADAPKKEEKKEAPKAEAKKDDKKAEAAKK